MTDREIIDLFLNEADIKENLARLLGPTGKITVDWNKREILAVSDSGGFKWDIDEILPDLRKGLLH